MALRCKMRQKGPTQETRLNQSPSPICKLKALQTSQSPPECGQHLLVEGGKSSTGNTTGVQIPSVLKCLVPKSIQGMVLRVLRARNLEYWALEPCRFYVTCSTLALRSCKSLASGIIWALRTERPLKGLWFMYRVDIAVGLGMCPP